MNVKPTFSLKINYGITGNYYAYSLITGHLIELCTKIGKSHKSIKWCDKYKCWVVRIKDKSHINKLKEYYI